MKSRFASRRFIGRSYQIAAKARCHADAIAFTTGLATFLAYAVSQPSIPQPFRRWLLLFSLRTGWRASRLSGHQYHAALVTAPKLFLKSENATTEPPPFHWCYFFTGFDCRQVYSPLRLMILSLPHFTTARKFPRLAVHCITTCR